MKNETIQLAIECVEEESTRVEDMMNWWGPGTSRHKRYANELSMLKEALADLREAEAGAWKEITLGEVATHKTGTKICINGESLHVIGRNEYELPVDVEVLLPHDVRVCRFKPQEEK